ncbi:MAG: hypothetical protein B6242_07845 [Anaerolineaceae bacterium 4572_78]|nr:MAG: hypothetical protein B6242_07845 [Anaerolineaceae bacterium 4572_78]
MQNVQSLKKDFMTMLDVLPLESLNVLIEFARFLQAKVVSSEYEQSKIYVLGDIDDNLKDKPIRVISPCLAHAKQAADFELEMISGDSHVEI